MSLTSPVDDWVGEWACVCVGVVAFPLPRLGDVGERVGTVAGVGEVCVGDRVRGEGE